MPRVPWLWGSSDYSTAAHSVQLDRGGRQWARALLGVNAIQAGSLQDSIPAHVSQYNPLGPRSPQAAGVRWNQQSAAPNARIMPVSIAFVQALPTVRNAQLLPQKGPTSNTAQQAQALNAQLHASMLAAQARVGQ